MDLPKDIFIQIPDSFAELLQMTFLL